MNLLVVNGPNINMLGIREPHIYGAISYAELIDLIHNWAKEYGVNIEVIQSNHEGVLVDKIQEALNKFDGIIINAGAYTHTSIALLDALKAVNIKTVEVHISNVFEREAFRQVNYIKEVCSKSFIGFGIEGYKLAISYFAKGE